MINRTMKWYYSKTEKTLFFRKIWPFKTQISKVGISIALKLSSIETGKIPLLCYFNLKALFDSSHPIATTYNNDKTLKKVNPCP